MSRNISKQNYDVIIKRKANNFVQKRLDLQFLNLI